MDSTPDTAAQPPRFELITHTGEARLRLAFRDRGVVVEPDALSVLRDGTWQRVPFSEIIAVQLSLASTGGSGAIGVCTIRRSNGTKLVVSTIAPSGLGDPAMEGIYRRFIEAFHGALVASGAAGHISFTQGFSSTRRGILFFGLAAGGVLFVALPLVLFLATGEAKALIPMLAGSALLFPFVRIYRTNAPRTYNAPYPPDLLP